MIRWSTFLGVAGAMGLTARDVDEMTLWEFRCVAAGFRKFNGGSDDKPKPPTSEEFADALATMGDLI